MRIISGKYARRKIIKINLIVNVYINQKFKPQEKHN